MARPLRFPSVRFFPRRVLLMPDPIQLNGMASAASALQMLERRQQVLANNLANATTRGFKGETPFARLMQNSLAATDTALDVTEGPMTETHSTLDLAIKGNGYFVTQTPSGERLTRDGSFALDADQRLVDSHGNPVLGEAGPITVPNGTVEIDTNGMVKVNGRPVQRLRLERVADGAKLQHEGGTQFVPDASRKAIPPEDRRIMQGFVEGSNVNTMFAMTQMIDVLREFSAAQKTMTTIDSVRGIATTEIGKPI